MRGWGDSPHNLISAQSDTAPGRHDAVQGAVSSSTGPSAATPSRTLVQSGAGFLARLSDYSAPYLQVGSPSPAVVTSGFVVLTPIPHEKFVSWLCVFVASQAPA